MHCNIFSVSTAWFPYVTLQLLSDPDKFPNEHVFKYQFLLRYLNFRWRSWKKVKNVLFFKLPTRLMILIFYFKMYSFVDYNGVCFVEGMWIFVFNTKCLRLIQLWYYCTWLKQRGIRISILLTHTDCSIVHKCSRLKAEVRHQNIFISAHFVSHTARSQLHPKLKLAVKTKRHTNEISP